MPTQSRSLRAEQQWVLAGLAVAAGLLVVQIGAGAAREAVSDEPSYLEKVQTCLTERSTPFEPVVGDPIASSARRGALRMVVEGTRVTVALGASEADAERLYGLYASVVPADALTTLLDRRRKVVYLWESAPTQAQRDFTYLCTLDAQE